MTYINFKLIGEKIRKRRQSLGITQEYIANILDVNPSHISNIECGRANPSLTSLIRIANILQCSVDTFIDEEYTFKRNGSKKVAIDSKIIDKLQLCSIEDKEKILQIIEIIES